MQGVGMTERGVRQAAALLVALAALADRSAYRCLAVRWFVLVLLRHAETVVLRVVGDATGWDRSALEVALGIEVPDVAEGRSSSGRGPADALALAIRLRALAALLRAFLPPDDLVGSGKTRTAGARAQRGAPAIAPVRVERPQGACPRHLVAALQQHRAYRFPDPPAVRLPRRAGIGAGKAAAGDSAQLPGAGMAATSDCPGGSDRPREGRPSATVQTLSAPGDRMGSLSEEERRSPARQGN